MKNMFGTMFCQYETPCGYCTRLNEPCNAKRDCGPKPRPTPVDLRAALKIEPDNKTQGSILNELGEYAVGFAQNHGITASEAMRHPTVKAYAAALERKRVNGGL